MQKSRMFEMPRAVAKRIGGLHAPRTIGQHDERRGTLPNFREHARRPQHRRDHEQKHRQPQPNERPPPARAHPPQLAVGEHHHNQERSGSHDHEAVTANRIEMPSGHRNLALFHSAHQTAAVSRCSAAGDAGAVEAALAEAGLPPIRLGTVVKQDGAERVTYRGMLAL